MKIVGLITEYNPFHNGHLYHIAEAKRVTGADCVVVVMSGDYVQRGLPAIMPKRLRADAALKCGASAVFELPVCYSTGSAELFAQGAVSLLDSLNVVDYLCFGSECGDLETLSRVADVLNQEPDEYRALLRSNLKKGCSFPAARQAALSDYLPKSLHSSSAILNDPNNILGIEYLKALKKIHSSIQPFTIKRHGSHYHDTTLSSEHLSSASAIRSLLAFSSSSIQTDLVETDYDIDSPSYRPPIHSSFEGTSVRSIFGELEGQVPASCLDLLKDHHKVSYPIYQNDFSLILKYKLLNKHPDSLIRYADISQELANRICSQLNYYFNYSQFSELLKTKELTQTRINRALLHIMLGIKTEHVSEYTNAGYHFYAKLLGFRKDQEHLISRISKESTLPLLTQLSRTNDISTLGRRMLRNDILASNLYTSVITDKYKTAFQNEFKQPLIKI